MAACAQADILHVGSESKVDLLVHTKPCQSCARYIAAMFNDRTCKESKGANWRLPHNARKIVWGNSLSCQCSHTHKSYRQVRQSGCWKIQLYIYWKNEYQSNASFIQLGDDSTGLYGWDAWHLKKCKPSLSLIMLSFPVLEERDARGRFICAQCVLSLQVLWKGCYGRTSM